MGEGARVPVCPELPACSHGSRVPLNGADGAGALASACCPSCFVGSREPERRACLLEEKEEAKGMEGGSKPLHTLVTLYGGQSWRGTRIAAT